MQRRYKEIVFLNRHECKQGRHRPRQEIQSDTPGYIFRYSSYDWLKMVQFNDFPGFRG